MARHYETEKGTVIYDLDITVEEDHSFLQVLFRKCRELAGEAFFFRGAHGGMPARTMNLLSGYGKDRIYALKDEGGLEFALSGEMDEAFIEWLVSAWDAYDQNLIWFFNAPPVELPTEMKKPETVILPPHIQLCRTDVDAVLVICSEEMSDKKKMLINSLGLNQRDTAV